VSLFEEQLKALRTTMSSVKPEEFDMTYWNCGTVSCICGHQELVEPQAPVFRKDKSAVDISDALDQACTEATGNRHLAESVYDGTAVARQDAALFAGRLTLEELNHPHLTTQSSPADAISYIDMLIEELS
jgi:hypothetical protein